MGTNLNNKDEEPFKGRNLNEANSALIIKRLKELDFKEAFSHADSYRQWGVIKRKILTVIDEIAPVKRIKKKSRNSLLSLDKELLLVKRRRDFLNTVDVSTKLPSDWSNYKEYRQKFESLYRKKLCKHFDDKTIGNFQTNKQYWDYYSPFILLKSFNVEKINIFSELL